MGENTKIHASNSMRYGPMHAVLQKHCSLQKESGTQ